MKIINPGLLSLAVLLLFLVGLVVRAEDFSEKKSDHFIVYYEDVPKDFVESVIEYAERYYTELTRKLGFTRYDYWTWGERAKIYLFADQDSFLKATRQPTWSSGIADYNEKTIWAFPRESGFFDSLLPHELGHIVFREAIGDRDVPLWLEEGVAQYLEQAKRLGSEKMVLDAMTAKTFISLDQLTKIDGYALRQRSDVSLFYAESANVVSYLIEKFGSSGFSAFCRKLKERKSLDDALGYAYFDVRDLRGLSLLWERYLNDKLKAKNKNRMML